MICHWGGQVEWRQEPGFNVEPCATTKGEELFKGLYCGKTLSWLNGSGLWKLDLAPVARTF